MDVEAEVEEEKKSGEDESNAIFQTERVTKTMLINNSNLNMKKEETSFERQVQLALEEHQKLTECQDKNCMFHNKAQESDSENEGIHHD